MSSHSDLFQGQRNGHCAGNSICCVNFLEIRHGCGVALTATRAPIGPQEVESF